MAPSFIRMKTFVRLVPASRDSGRFFCPRAPNGAGMQLTPAGLGYVWWNPSARIAPELLLQLPSALASLVFATCDSDRLSLWIKFPWRDPLLKSLVIVISLRRDDGTYLNLAWSPQSTNRADAVDILAACPGLDGAWIGEEQALLDQHHGRIVSLEHYHVSAFTYAFDREAA